MRILAVIALLSLMVMSQVTLGLTIPREEVLECGLLDGSKFVLRAKYDWDPRSVLIPVPVTERYNEQNFRVSFYSAKKFRRSIVIPFEAFEHTRLGGAATAKGLCSAFALIRGNAVLYQYIIFADKYTLKEINAGSLKGVSIAASENSPEIQTELVARKLEPLYGTSFFGYIDGRYVHEQGLTAAGQKCDSRPTDEKQCSIDAVSRNISTDNGKTWIGPSITNNSEIFELGKSLREQSFIARPLRVNGKSFESIEREEARLKSEAAKRDLAAIEAMQKKSKKTAQEYAKTLDSAIVSSDMARFEKLLNAGVNIDAPIQSPYRRDPPTAPLLVALEKPESSYFAITLIKRGASLSPVGLYEGVNVLMLAAGNSTPEVLKALLAKQKFDVNQRNPNGATALSYAVAGGRIENVRLLLELGADTQIKTSEGSLIDIARLQGHTEIVKLLERRE